MLALTCLPKHKRRKGRIEWEPVDLLSCRNVTFDEVFIGFYYRSNWEQKQQKHKTTTNFIRAYIYINIQYCALCLYGLCYSYVSATTPTTGTFKGTDLYRKLTLLTRLESCFLRPCGNVELYSPALTEDHPLTTMQYIDCLTHIFKILHHYCLSTLKMQIVITSSSKDKRWKVKRLACLA